VGYRILHGFEVPPLMFTLDEVEALVAGLRMVESWGGPALAKASQSAMEKIAMVLPSSRITEVEGTRLFAPGFHLDPKVGDRLELIRGAILRHYKLRLTYSDAGERVSNRTVRPLAMHYWGTAWTLAAWCETKIDFRNFRLDRIRQIEVSEEKFRPEAGKTLDDFLRKMRGQSANE
jgi:predicted DNA-binding transcriptional regulator YafY